MKFEFSPHIAFQVKDYVKAKDFYEKILGMEIISTSETETHFKKKRDKFLYGSIRFGFYFF